MGARLSPRKELGAPQAYNRDTQPSGPMSRDEALKKVFEYAPASGARPRSREDRNLDISKVEKDVSMEKYLRPTSDHAQDNSRLHATIDPVNPRYGETTSRENRYLGAQSSPGRAYVGDYGRKERE